MVPGIAKGKTTVANAPTVPVAEINRVSAEAQNMNIFEKLDAFLKDWKIKPPLSNEPG